MKKSKVIHTLIILLFIGSIFITLFKVEKCDSEGNDIYVNVNYAFNDGDGRVDTPYRYIQNAINVANEGDTIYVFGGTYNESLVIDKKISIIGSVENGNSIISRGGEINKYLIEITADHVTLEHFDIYDAPNGRSRIALIYVTANYLNLQTCNITQCNEYGVYLYQSGDNIVGYGNVSNNKGIYSYQSNNNVFSNNGFGNCSDAAIRLVGSDNNIIYDNEFGYNNYAIFSLSSSNNNISSNTIDDSTLDGIRLVSGSNNSVRDNSVNYNTADGLRMDSSGSIISGNLFNGNQIGIDLLTSNCWVYSNTFKNSDLYGIYTNPGTTNTYFYSNSFLLNIDHAQDDGNNHWYYGTLGNYWDDYDGLDRDLDEIGDSAYIINGGGLDMYPTGNFLSPPAKPTTPYPADGASSVGLSVTLSIVVTDTDSDYLDVFFYDASNDELCGEDHNVPSDGTASCNFALPFQTTYSWYAVVNDSQLENQSNIYIFTTKQIPPENEKPVSDPGGPYISEIGEEVTFDASNSNDPDGSIIFYRWNFGDGSSEILDISPTHSYSSGGTYTVTLTIVDDDGRSDTAETYVAVGADANLPPEADAGGPYEGTVGESILFDGSNSNDADGTIDSYSWDFGDESTGSGITTNHEYSGAGTYLATLFVTDDDGDTQYTTVTVKITSPTSVGVAFGLDLFTIAIIIVIIVVVIIVVLIFFLRRRGIEESDEEYDEYDEDDEEFEDDFKEHSGRSSEEYEEDYDEEEISEEFEDEEFEDDDFEDYEEYEEEDEDKKK